MRPSAQSATPDATVQGNRNAVAKELGGEPVGGVAIDLLWAADLCETPVAHDRDLIRDRQRLFLVVGYQERCHARVGEQTGDRLAGGRAQSGVERAERLIEQHQDRLPGECTGQCDPLLLASGQLVRAPRRVRRVEGNGLEKLTYTGMHVGAGGTAQAVRDVLPDRQVREQRTVLRDIADASTVRCHSTFRTRHLTSVDRDRARIGRLESGDEPQQRGLAASR